MTGARDEDGNYYIEGNAWKLKEVRSCTPSPVDGEGGYRLSVVIHCPTGDIDDNPVYVSRPDDPFGANPVIRAWIAENA